MFINKPINHRRPKKIKKEKTIKPLRRSYREGNERERERKRERERERERERTDEVNRRTYN